MRFTKQLRNTFKNKGLETYKYEHGKIYKLTSNETNNIYIGSTISNLKKRFYSHKGHYKSYIKNKKSFYCSSFEIIKFKDCKIEIILDYPCNNKRELEKKEQYYQLNTKNIVNINTACGIDNKQKIVCECGDKINHTIKERHIKTKTHINKMLSKERRKNPEQIICDCGYKLVKSRMWNHIKSDLHKHLMIYGKTF